MSGSTIHEFEKVMLEAKRVIGETYTRAKGRDSDFRDAKLKEFRDACLKEFKTSPDDLPTIAKRKLERFKRRTRR